MVDTERLNAIIADRGVTKKHIAGRMGLSAYGLARKLDGRSDFYTREVVRLCDLLQIDVADRDSIFFK